MPAAYHCICCSFEGAPLKGSNAAGVWGIGDDRRLLKALLKGGYSTEWQVDWSTLIPQRTATAARRRWQLMLKSVPDHQEKGFADIVDELVTMHLPVLKQRLSQGAATLQGQD